MSNQIAYQSSGLYPPLNPRDRFIAAYWYARSCGPQRYAHADQNMARAIRIAITPGNGNIPMEYIQRIRLNSARNMRAYPGLRDKILLAHRRFLSGIVGIES